MLPLKPNLFGQTPNVAYRVHEPNFRHVFSTVFQFSFEVRMGLKNVGLSHFLVFFNLLNREAVYLPQTSHLKGGKTERKQSNIWWLLTYLQALDDYIQGMVSIMQILSLSNLWAMNMKWKRKMKTQRSRVVSGCNFHDDANYHFFF